MQAMILKIFKTNASGTVDVDKTKNILINLERIRSLEFASFVEREVAPQEQGLPKDHQWHAEFYDSEVAPKTQKVGVYLLRLDGIDLYIDKAQAGKIVLVLNQAVDTLGDWQDA